MHIDNDKKIELDDKFCPICGKKFFSIYAWQKYCSDACNYKAKLLRERQRNVKPKLEKICLHCGKSFLTSYPRQKYCSNECLKLSQPKYTPVPKIKKVCELCGNAFYTSRPTKNFCSFKCYQKNYHLTHKPVSHICKCCGKKFWTRSNSVTKYCSDECRKIMSKELKVNQPKTEKEKSTLDRLIEEADACGLSYGIYKAQIAMGRTFEELKSDYEKRWDNETYGLYSSSSP